MKDYQAIANGIRNDYSNLSSMRVLEVGSDVKGGLLTALAPHVKEVIGVNLVGRATQFASNARFEVGDIRDLDFEASSFDLIVSHAVFEHVQDFDQGLATMHRLLKPGGELTSQFGPIWSCPWGHHLWIAGEDFKFTYWQEPLLPPYCHLLMDPDELRIHLADQMPEPQIEQVVKFVYESPEQNRLLHRDYLSAFERSEFAIKSVVSGRNRQLETAYEWKFGPLDSYQDELTARHGECDFLSSSFELRLVNQTESSFIQA